MSARSETGLTPERLAGERWFAAKGRDVDRIEQVDAVAAGAGSLALVDVSFADGSAERYAMPDGAPLWGPLLGRLARGPERGFRLSGGGAAVLTSAGGVERRLDRDQSNSSYVLDERVLVKCYRRLWPGVHPEVELVSFLAERCPAVPAALGALHYVDESGAEWALALMQQYVPAAEDGWGWCRQLVEEAAAGADIDVAWAAAVGSLTAELHGALAELGSREASDGELATRRRTAELDLDRVSRLAGPVATDRLRDELARFERPSSAPLLYRVHGDYHVGQILRSPAGYHVIDFEGEPTRSLEERRALDSPLRDVASMLRSIDHVPLWVLRDRPQEHALAERWASVCRAAFLEGYGEWLDRQLLRAFEAEKAAYEFAYAESFLPEWLPIAGRGAELLLSREIDE